MKNSGCATILSIAVLLIAVSFAIQNPYALIALVVVVGLAIFGGIKFSRAAKMRKSLSDKSHFENQSQKLSHLASSLGAGFNSSLSLRKGEVLVYVLPAVGLIETRSTGSTWSGGSQGVSIRIMKGVSYRVGATKGQLVRNPEALQQVDQGAATFTNQRVVFTGSSTNREWAFDKMLNVDAGGGGVTVNMAVSNRQKTSGLVCLDFDDITPGFAVAIANDFAIGGLEQAKKRCLDLAAALAMVAEGKSEEEASVMANSLNPADRATPVPAGADVARIDEGGQVDIVGESFYADIFESIRTSLGLDYDSKHATDVELVAEPENTHSANGHAVAVHYNGSTVGYVPEEYNTPFFDLLNKFGGKAICRSEIYFGKNDGEIKNSVRLLCVFPPTASS